MVVALQLRQISKNFGAIRALTEVNLSLEPGEVLGLMGDNGAGKSTPLKIIAGNFLPSSGEIMLVASRSIFISRSKRTNNGRTTVTSPANRGRGVMAAPFPEWETVVPRVNGVLETSLYVANLDRAADFYRRLFGFETFVDDERMCGLGVGSGQVLLLFRHGATNKPASLPNGDLIPPHRGEGNLHLCFSIPFGELAAWEQHLAREGIPVESRVHWGRGGTSLYFRDPDGHSIEIATPGLWPNF